MTKTEQEIKKIVEPVVIALGYCLYDVEFIKEKENYFLRIYIEKEEHTIDLDDCEKVSEAVGAKLDEVDPITTPYNLEVSSCGLERHLREVEHFERAVGKRIFLHLYKSIQKKKEIEGILQSVTNDVLKIKLEEAEEEIEIDLKDVASAKLVYNWEELKNE